MMLGVSFFVILLMFIFCFLILLSGDLIILWSLLEIISLCLVPCFSVGGVLALLNYLVASSVSSIMILVGLVFPECYYVFGFGLYVKFGIFPFMGWLYNVLDLSSSWLVCWAISVLLKVPLLFLVYFFWNSCLILSIFLSVLSLLVLGVNFWLLSVNWIYVWCHMMISSSVVMFVLGSIINLEFYIVLFLVYFIWCSGVIYYLAGGGGVFGYILWLLSVPFSFSLIYKVFTCYLLCSVVSLLLFWFVYSFSEQFYLVKWLMSSYVPKFIFKFIA